MIDILMYIIKIIGGIIGGIIVLFILWLVFRVISSAILDSWIRAKEKLYNISKKVSGDEKR